jgi:cysteine desulfuration protein SufE
MLVKVLSGHTPEEIASADLYFMERIGLHQHLAQTRSNGLAAMLKQMKAYGFAYQAKSENA